MKLRTILFTVALLLIANSAALAASPHMGTWKLNEAKSKIAPGGAKNHTVVYEAAPGNRIKVIVDGTNAEGQATHSEWTGRFNGKSYDVIGDPTSDSRSYRVLNVYTLTFRARRDGKVTLTGQVVVSADGKTRTVTTWSTNAQGEKVKSVAVYDKA